MARRTLRLTAVLAAIVLAGCGTTSKSSPTAAKTAGTPAPGGSTSTSTSTQPAGVVSSKLAARLLASNELVGYVRQGSPAAASSPDLWAVATNVPAPGRAAEQALLPRLGFLDGATEVVARKTEIAALQSPGGTTALSAVAEFRSAKDAGGYLAARYAREKAAAKPGEFIAVPVPGIPNSSAYALRGAEQTSFTIAFTDGPYAQLLSMSWPTGAKNGTTLGGALAFAALKLSKRVGKLSGG